MHRRKPISAKQRKEQLQLKRAVKRGEVPALPAKPDRPRKARPGLPLGAASREAAAESTRRLESAFVRLPPAFLERTKVLASILPLTRPIPPEAAILSDVDTPSPGADSQLTCPKRPKWRYDMSKIEVEANEEGLFKKWLAQTDAALAAWSNPTDVGQPPVHEGSEVLANPEPDSMPHAPTSYERNLEVWRQLWRVTEISQILLILLDSRCPTLHLPPALTAYLAGVSNASRLRTILVLTKVDIAGPDRAAAWTKYLTTRYPGVRVVQVESYTEKHPDGEASSRRMYQPHLPSTFRQSLVETLRETHAELLEPPPAVRDNPDRLANWKPRIKSEVDWDAVLKAHGGQVGHAVGGAAAPKLSKAEEADATAEGHSEEDDDSEPEFLTIGLIGQPNVGKSSLLNALFGTQKVRASRTPGKTKHFQTLFWTRDVRLVDCPGLVIPNYIPMETQVLSGILPISRVSAIPLCIYHAASVLPLEKILGLSHPSLASPPVQDKRTWREGMRPPESQQQQRALVWTAMDILTAYANKKGWVTAKAGRPDVNRAGNAILRAVAEGRIPWAFWPPGTDPQTITAHQRGADAVNLADDPGTGIWIQHGHDGDADIDAESDAEDEEDRPRAVHFDEGAVPSDEDDDEGDAEGAESESEEEDEGAKGTGKARLPATTGRFGALVLDNEGDEDEDEEDEG
ncbi:P-loop containing nucleoside triphosphate hydrolase protein [Polyporus arcularius HHB13444]|uniref:Guanine nucleotide-binding protein-like 1 n=1 Tax=Polyporus arcularius HHB13444 TaxID=1314778 RepID=A0A5C3PM36_9APHY|nr:P-loop containing nucleoside triphosphate hydrolase protein [Polyporus arcularius HHB13444]